MKESSGMSYVKLIVNPAAGAGKAARKWPLIQGLLRSIGVRFEHELTEAPGHAVELAEAAVKQGYGRLVSVGGDGTVNEVVNGMYAAGNSDVELGIISTGTGSDYVRTLGISRSYESACHFLLAPRKRSVDLGMLEYRRGDRSVKRLFVNFAGFGFDAEIVRRTTQGVKVLGSTASYLTGLFTSLACYRNSQVSLTLDGEVWQGKVCTVLMSNGRYGGGGMLTAPQADPADGLLDVVIVGDLSKPDLLRSLPRIYKGTHLTHAKVMLKRARTVAVSPARPLPLQADGELLGEVPVKVRVLPGALKIVV